MAITNAVPAAASNFKPAFNRVQQSNDFDCAFSCVAMVAGKSLVEVRQAAIDKFKHPKVGPFWITEELIGKLLGHFGYASTAYKETRTIADLPDVAIVMIDYDATTEVGRHVLFYRQRGAAGKPAVVECVIDPANWVTDPAKQMRTDVKAIAPSYYIGVQPKTPVK